MRANPQIPAAAGPRNSCQRVRTNAPTKFGEEAVEALIEAVKGDRAALTSEAADVLYHLLVMLASRDVALDDVFAELSRRTAQSGLDEKARR